MSGESTDSETTPSNNSNRSRSLLRQVREKLGGIHRSRPRTDECLTSSFVNGKRASFDQPESEPYLRKKLRAPALNSFSHHFSLLSHVKSHLVGPRKHRQTAPSKWTDDDYTHLSLPQVATTLESRSSSTIDGSPDPLSNGERNSSPFAPLINTTMQNGDNRSTTNASLNTSIDDKEQQNGDVLTDLANRALSSSRTSLHKLKDQVQQHARIVATRTPSLSSFLNTSSSSLEQVYWVEICLERGKDLAVKDINGSSDPYVKVIHNGEEKYVSNTVTKSLNPVWNEKFSFFVTGLQSPLYFNLFDYDRIGRDEPMGSTKLDLWKLPLDRSYPVTLELENEKRNDGKTGLLKLSISLTLKSSEFRDEVLRNLMKHAPAKISLSGRIGSGNSATIVTRRTIDIFIIEGRNFTAFGPNKSYSPYIRLKFGTNKKYRTQTIKMTQNPKWHQSFMYDIVISELPALELTVIDESSGSGEFIGRGICNIAHLEEERTHRIPVDLEDGAGVIDLFVTITGTTPLQEATNDGESSSNVALESIPSRFTEGDLEHYKFVSSLRAFKPVFDVGKLEIKIYQARDLSSKDINGKSDPFCTVELDSTRLRTHTIYKTLDPAWNKSFIIPVQDIHSVLELTIYDEDMNKSTEFIGKVSIPLLAVKNGVKKWMALKDRKCVLPVKGALEIEATLIFTNLKAVVRTFNPRQETYYPVDTKFRVGILKQHINRVQNMLKGFVSFAKFINFCFQWENPALSFAAFTVSLVIVWNFELYMLPCSILLLFAKNAVVEYRYGRLGKTFVTTEDETVSAIVQTASVDEDALENEGTTKEQKKSWMATLQSVQETVLEIQGYVDGVASTLERIKNVFKFTVPWLSVVAIVVFVIIAIMLYFIPFRYLVLAFVINKFTKRFRKPKGYIDNNELADYLSRLPSDPELMQYRELKVLSRVSTPKKGKH